MAKRDDKKKSSKQSRGEALRSAVDQAFQATADQAEGTQKRMQDLAEELQTVAGRLREALEGARPVTAADVDDLRGQLEALGKRVSALESAGKPAARATTARKPAARRPAARKPAAAKPVAAKPAAARTAAKPAAARATRKPAAAKAPAARRAAAPKPSA